MNCLLLVSAASAVTLNMKPYDPNHVPDYYADGYSDTWSYTTNHKLVNETAYVMDQPTEMNDVMEGFPGATPNTPYKPIWLPTTVDPRVMGGV